MSFDKNMLYFAAPVGNPAAVKDKILVTSALHERNDHLVGQVKQVRPGSASYDRGITFTTTDGDYVGGVPANEESAFYNYVVGTSPAHPGKWFVGYAERYTGEANNVLVTGRALRSDGVPAPGGNTWTGIALETWFRAAQWAWELMPQPHDSTGVRVDKLALAKKRWEFNHALAVVETEGIARDWSTNLETLHEDLDWLPTYEGSAFITGHIEISRDGSAIPVLSSAEQEKALEIKRKFEPGITSIFAAATGTMNFRQDFLADIGIPLKGGRFTDPVQPHRINRTLRTITGDGSARIAGDFMARPVLRYQHNPV